MRGKTADVEDDIEIVEQSRKPVPKKAKRKKLVIPLSTQTSENPPTQDE
jgi:hypothetical protein